MKTRLLSLVAMLIMAGVVILFSCEQALAQCSMCRASLTSANAAFIRNFNIGVLVLLIPPVTMFCSIFVILRRHKLRDDEAEPTDDPTQSKIRN